MNIKKKKHLKTFKNSRVCTLTNKSTLKGTGKVTFFLYNYQHAVTNRFASLLSAFLYLLTNDPPCVTCVCRRIFVPMLHVAAWLGPWDDASLLADTSVTRGDSPEIIIIAVSTAGSTLLLLNIILITCYFVRQRKKKCMEEGNSMSLLTRLF